MRLSSYSLALLAGLLALSCNREDAREPSLSPAEEECVVHFTLKGEDGKIERRTIGDAQRIPGVSPNDISVLLVLAGR